MKIARFDEERIGVVVGDTIVDVTEDCGLASVGWPPIGMTRLIAGFDSHRDRLVAAARKSGRPLKSVKLLTPVPWPNKVIAYPVNYKAHGVEMAAGYSANNQGFFLKPNSALSGAGEPIVLPDLPERQIHHECELAIIIGKGGRAIPAKDWQSHVFGYACLLDMVVRGKEERVMRKGYAPSVRSAPGSPRRTRSAIPRQSTRSSGSTTRCARAPIRGICCSTYPA